MIRATVPPSRRQRRVAPLAITTAAAVALALTACSGAAPASTSSDGASATHVDAAAAKLVPSDIKAAGTFTVAVDPTFPPSGYYNSSKKLVGADVDLATAIGQSLGLKPHVVAASFDSIIPGIESGKYTAGMSLINVTAAREKTLDFVGYFKDGSSIMAPSATKLAGSATLDDLCGHSVAVQRAAIQAGIASQQSKKCVSEGKSPIDVQVFPDYNSATLAIVNGRADAGLFDQTNAAYTAKQSASKLKVVGSPIGQTPCGIATDKGNGMAAAIQAALSRLITAGTYQKVLSQYGLQAGAVTTADVNPSAS